MTTGTDAMVDVRYRTFWRRAAAATLDFLVLLPLGALILWLGPVTSSAPLRFLLYIVNAGAALAYSILLHGRYGQTLGKKVTHVRVLDVPGGSIGMRQAVWRDSPLLVFAVLDVVWATTLILRGMNPFRLQSDIWMPLSLAAVNTTWLVAEFVTMLTNSKRRAVHDWIARTVVVRT